MSDERRILLRIPADLHHAVKVRAEEAGVSVNTMIERLLHAGLRLDPTESLIVETARRRYGTDFLGLILFGSRARGDTHASSDTDLLLVVGESVTIQRGLYREWDAALPAEISIHIAHLPADRRNPGSLWLECALDGKILADPTGRISTTLAALRELITSGAVIRRTTHGQGYWVSR